MILLVDNYDSFSYNLYQLAGSINPDMKVIRNDEMTIDEIRALAPASIILSPGPGRPEQAGRCMEIVEKLGGEIPILGVCLGHQAICAAYGATVMAVEDSEKKIYGVQFHPESILTPQGRQMVENFLKITR